MKLAYVAYDDLGKAQAGVIEAADANTATDTLRRRGLYVSKMDQASTTEPKKAAAGRSRKRKLSRGQKTKSLALFTRQLHVLVSSGMQLLDALGALERQASAGPWRGHCRQAASSRRTRGLAQRRHGGLSRVF